VTSVVSPMFRQALSAVPAQEASPLPIGQRTPTVSERLEKFKALSEQAGRLLPDRSQGRPSIPGVTDELPPAYDGNSRADNHVSKLHTEIKLNGKTIARIYNSGAAEFADDYAFLARGFDKDTKVGPDLAESRLARVTAALERHGMITKDKQEIGGLKIAPQAGTPIVDILRASTAQTQQEWLEFKATESPPPGALVSRTA